MKLSVKNLVVPSPFIYLLLNTLVGIPIWYGDLKIGTEIRVLWINITYYYFYYYFSSVHNLCHLRISRCVQTMPILASFWSMPKYRYQDQN